MGKVSEWFWRFLAAVMLIAVGWALWIFYQINPAPLATGAAFEAAAKARASQSASGRIAPAPRPPEAREPPVNVEKLRLSDTITAPEPEGAQTK